ncbi:hypothetical protein KC345_g100 [Hortaea werneckii]|nr:hypothetical protein KC345_g100 [Hortaea werneckii]
MLRCWTLRYDTEKFLLNSASPQSSTRCLLLAKTSWARPTSGSSRLSPSHAEPWARATSTAAMFSCIATLNHLSAWLDPEEREGRAEEDEGGLWPIALRGPGRRGLLRQRCGSVDRSPRFSAATSIMNKPRRAYNLHVYSTFTVLCVDDRVCRVPKRHANPFCGVLQPFSQRFHDLAERISGPARAQFALSQRRPCEFSCCSSQLHFQ